MREEVSYICPLINREMWEAECYDVQMVRYGFINPRILDFILVKSKSDIVCEDCSFNQLKYAAKTKEQMITALL